jgi:hypothetical protein
MTEVTTELHPNGLPWSGLRERIGTLEEQRDLLAAQLSNREEQLSEARQHREQAEHQHEIRTAELTAANMQLTEALSTITALRQRWDTTWEKVHEHADEAGWCGEYDAMVELVGGPPRMGDVVVTIEASVSSDLDTEAREWLETCIGGNNDVRVREATIEWDLTIKETRNVPRVDCGCDDLDTNDVETWLRENNVPYDSVNMHAASCGFCS